MVAQAAKNMFVEKVSPTKDLGIAAVSGIAGSMFNGLYEVGTKAAGKILPKLGGLVQKTIPNVANWISKTIPRFGEYAVSAVDGFFGALFINTGGNFLSTPGVLANSGRRTGETVDSGMVTSSNYVNFLISNYKPLLNTDKLTIGNSKFVILAGSGG